MLFVGIIKHFRNVAFQRSIYCFSKHPMNNIPGFEKIQEFSDSEDWSADENPSDTEIKDEFNSSGDDVEIDVNYPGDIK